MTSLRQLKRFEARTSLFKSLDCPLALAAAGRNQRFTRYPPVINHNLGWCNCPWFETPRRSYDVTVTGHPTSLDLARSISRHFGRRLFKVVYMRGLKKPSSALILSHYSDAIMSTMASHITNASIVCSIVCSVADQRKHQSSASLAFVRGIHRRPVNSPHKGPVTRKMIPSSCLSPVWQDIIRTNTHWYIVDWNIRNQSNLIDPWKRIVG